MWGSEPTQSVEEGIPTRERGDESIASMVADATGW